MPNLPYISPELLREYQRQINLQASPATAKRRMAALKRFFGWAHKEGYISANPVQENIIIIPKSRFRPANMLKLGIPVVLVILVFLLARKMKLPIPFLPAPASETGSGQIPTITPPPPQAGAVLLSPWTIYAKMNLKDSTGNPLTTSQTITFKIYRTETDTQPLWTSEPKTVIPDVNGDTLISLNDVPTELFFENEKLYLAPVTAVGEPSERIPVSTANVASNLQGYFPKKEAGPNTIPVINEEGALVLASEAPAIKAKTGNLLIEGQAVTIATPTASDGDITINPDGSGIAHFLFEGTGQNFLNAQAPNLTSGSLFYGVVANNSTGYDLIRLQSGSNPITRFSVDASGNTNLGGNLLTSNTQRLTSSGALTNIAGYTQTSGSFSINQGEGDAATITKKASALSDLLTLTLDERGKSNSIYSTLTLKRYDGAIEAMALYVDEGNAQFDGQLRLGRFATNPDAIGTGSIVYNSTDNKIYFWNGSAWTEVGAGTVPWSEIDNPTANLSLTHAAYTTTFGWTATGALDPWTFNLINNAGSATAQRFVSIVNAVTSQTVDVNTEALLRLDNADTSASGGSTFVDDAILITNTGGITAGVIDAVDASATEIVNALNAGPNVILGTTAAIDFTNFAVSTAGNITVQGGYGLDTIAAGTLALGDTTATTINIGTNATARTIALGGTGANSIAIGNTQTAGSISLGATMTGGTVSIGGTGAQTGTISLGTGTGGQTISLGTGAGAKAVSVGSTNTTSSLTLNSGSGVIDIGTSIAKTISIGNVTGATAVNFNTGTAGSTFTTTNGIFTLNTGTGAISLGTDAVAKTISIGNTTGASATSLNAGSGNLTLNATAGNLALTTTTSGNITMAPGGAGDINVTTDADSFLNLAGLTSSAGSVLCVDGANNVVTCTSGGGILWNQIGSPNGNQTLTMGAYTTTWNWDSLTSGTGLTVGSAATAFTGTLGHFTLTGNNAANTGTVLKASSTGASSTGTVAMITNLGAGTSFRVNDETGDADTTPFIIDASGNIGIGDTTPDAKLEVLSTTEQLRLTNVDDTTDARFTVSSTGDLTIDLLGSGTTDQLVLGDADTINIGSGTASDVAYNLIADAADAKDEAAIASDNDLYIGGDLEVDGTIYGTITASDLVCTDCVDASDLADTLDFDTATETSWTFQANNVTSQSFLTVTTDGLTSGTGTTFDLTATGVTTAFSGDLVKLNQTQTYTGGAGTQSGNVLDIARSVTRDITTAGDLALSGALATISDTAATSGAGTGTLTHSADVLRIAQNYTSNTGSALNVTSAGGPTGFALRVNDDGTFTDSTPFVVTNAGDVGIGTTGPGQKFEVSGGDIEFGTGHLRFKRTDTASGYVLWNAQAGSGFQLPDATILSSVGGTAIQLLPNSGTSNGLTLLNTGNVGIGTTAPTSLLQLLKTQDAVTGIRVENEDTGVSAGAQLWLRQATVDATLTVYGQNSGRKVVLQSADTTTPITFEVNNGSIIEAMRIMSSGNVGIGTASPIAPLQIAGTPTETTQYGIYLNTALTGTTQSFGGKIIPSVNSVAASGVYGLDVRPVFAATSGGPQGNYYGLTAIPTIAAAASANVTSAYAGYFRVDNSSTSGSVLTNAYGLYVAPPTTTGTITNKYALITDAGAGNVGIGTTGPSYPLHISSTETNDFMLALNNSQASPVTNDGANIQFLVGGVSSGQIKAAREDDTGTASYLTFNTRQSSSTNERVRITSAGYIGIGDTTPSVQLNVGTADTTHGLGASDALISDALEVDGVLYLDGKNISNPSGTAVMQLCVAGGPACATTSEIEHSLTNGSWTIANPAIGNVGKAALIVVQNLGGDLFTASAGATTKFKIANDGNVTIDGSGTMLTVGGGTGKINVGTVDPVYSIGGEKFATYMAGMVGVKEETTGNISTSQYIPGVGYRTVIDFKAEAEGSDLWLFSRTTDIKNNIGKMVVLLSPADNTRTWYEVDEGNYTLSIYSSRPTTISYRLTAPRFDYVQWSNYNNDPGSTGFQVEDAPLVASGEAGAPKPQALTDFEIVKEVPETIYKVYQTISEGSKIVVEEFGAFANLVAGNIKAGAIESKEITTQTFNSFQGTIDNMLITSGLVSPTIQTETISPLADKSDVKVKIGNEDINSGFGKLTVENTQGEEVASIDTAGNATFSGTLEAEEIKTNEIIAGKIYADEIVARNGYFGETNTATVSGITREEIEELLRNVESDQSLLAQASTWNINTATDSANLEELAVSNLYVTAQAAVNSLSVSSSLTIGSDLVIQSTINDQQLTINSIDTLSAPLSIQSLALAPVEIMAGKVRVDTNGDVTITGNLYVAGRIESSGLTLKEKATEDGNPVNENGGFGRLLSLKNLDGSEVAYIDASGSAYFDKLVIAGSVATTSASFIDGLVTQTNATAGEATIPPGTREITIKNPKITSRTLVYVTPTSSTLNNVLYVKAKGEGFFVAGFSQSINVSTTFNWWVIDVEDLSNGN